MLVIYHENELYDLADAAITFSTEHPNFPATNLKNRMIGEPWRSQYGSGSSWGRFEIVAAQNDRLDFTDSFAAALTAILTPAVYNADTLAAHVKAQMEAVSGDTFTIYLIEAGVNILHWYIESDDAGGGGTITLPWNTGANSARSIGSTIGFDVTADDAGALNYTSDYVAIHTEEFVDFDLGAATDLRGFFLRRHNVQAVGTAQALADNNPAFPAGITLNFTIQNNILVALNPATVNYRYVRFIVEDPTNAAGYVELGVASASPEFRSDRNFAPGKLIQPQDPSLTLPSTGRQEVSVQLERFKKWKYAIQGTAQRAAYESFFDNVGESLPFFYVEDDENPLTTVRYVGLRGFNIREFAGGDRFNVGMTFKEEL